MDCLACGAATGAPAFAASRPLSLTSKGEVMPGRTVHHFCRRCGHLQTPPLVDPGQYYAEEYRMMLASEDEDQLVTLSDGSTAVRTAHQRDLLQAFGDPPPSARVLDYGSGKAPTLRRLMADRPDVQGFVFDVSEAYREIWDHFLPKDHQAVFDVPAAWKGSFDLVQSFFALEHAEGARAFMAQVADLLKPGGALHLVVPDWQGNPGDFVVVDHTNHFSAASLRVLATAAGLEVERLESSVHPGAFVLRARKAATSIQWPDAAELEGLAQAVAAQGAWWEDLARRVQAFVAETKGPLAIYGSGFYGAYLASCLSDLNELRAFLDRNPDRQSQRLLDRPILPPEQLPAGVARLLVGLNPAHAAKALGAFAGTWPAGLRVFYP